MPTHWLRAPPLTIPDREAMYRPPSAPNAIEEFWTGWMEVWMGFRSPWTYSIGPKGGSFLPWWMVPR